MTNLVFHHVGCAVANIGEALKAYKPLTLNVGEVIPVSSQSVNVCFLELGPQLHVELVEPSGEVSMISQLLKKRVSFYHLGFLAANFDEALDELTTQDHHHLSTFRSEAFGMRRCAFLASPAAHLIEIIEEAG